MAMTKAEAAKLTQDMMLKGVIETIVTESMILELLPFMDLDSTAGWSSARSPGRWAFVAWVCVTSRGRARHRGRATQFVEDGLAMGEAS